MKNLRFHRTAQLEQLLFIIFKGFLWIVGILLIPQASTAQPCEIFSIGNTPYCDKVTAGLTGNDTWLTHHWDFGDGTPIVSGGPSLFQVFHDYSGDINPFASPLPVVRHSQDGANWCEIPLSQILPYIIIGTGCGSQRTVSTLVAANKLPSTELIGKTLLIYGDLEVDIPYKFVGCSIFVMPGGKISVTSGGALTLIGNTMLDAIYNSNDANCQKLWNGIEVFSGGSLTTNGASIRNAYFAISPVNPGNNNPLPKLSLRSTTFQRNFIGIYATQGSFALSLFLNNTMTGSGNIPTYPASSCSSLAQINGVPYSQRTYCGIYFDGSAGGSLLLAGQSTGNLFQNMQAGIVAINGTTRITGCRFVNINYLTGAPAAHQGTSVTFIDNIGGKRLNFVGLGKEDPLATINNCERGVYALTSKPATEAYISACRMVEVQNGVDMEETGAGNLTKGWVTNCYIGCTKYLPNIKKRSTGIELKDPNIAYSNFQINGNDIDMDQPEAFTPFVNPEILPTGISVTAMHNQASSNGMLLNITLNQVNLIAGINGITTENIVNANKSGNGIVKTKESSDIYRCISVVGGLDNGITCNITTNFPQGGQVGIPIGILCESTLNAHVSQNSAKEMATCLQFRADNATDCVISYNDVENSDPNIILGTGIFYFDACTGPQYLRGNDWLGDFALGAAYENGPNGFTYCDSRYHVSLGANVNNAVNPVNEGPLLSCGTWFTTQEIQEDDYTCGGTTGGGGTLSKNEADLNLAGGGTSSLSPGYKWTSEMGLIRKFTENPVLATGDAIINGFLQAQQGQPVEAMYGVRNSINGLEAAISTALLGNIQNTSAQLDATEAAMLTLLGSIDSDPNVLASFTALSAQAGGLEQSLQSYLISALGSMATGAAAVSNTNNNISATILPGTAERYINGLYLETQFTAPRALSTSELEAERQIGLYCPGEAGSIVYLARAWYYLQTGEMVYTDCGSFAPPLEGGERNIDQQPVHTEDWVLMPNPADGSVTVNFPANAEDGILMLTDLWGRLLLQRKVSDLEGLTSLTIPTEELTNGIYLVSVKEKSGRSLVKRLTITH
jgi:hypothetical protein